MNALLPPPVQAPKPNDPVPTEKPKTAAPSPQRHKMRGALRWMGGISLSVILVAAVLWFAVLRPPLVEVVTVRRGNLTAEIEGTGTVTADSLANVASKITGRVEQVFVDQGDAVTRGQIIATLDETGLRRDVDAARARLAAASDSSSERRREWEREKTLTKSGAVSTEDSQQYRERASVAQSTALAATADVARAEYELSLAQIPALVSGIVINRWVVPGASVVAGQQMFSIADTSLIYVSAYIDQSDGGKLAKGQAASVILRGREDHPLQGHLLRISPQADAGTEEMIAEVAFTNPAGDLQLGQWANVYVQIADVKDGLLIPGGALTAMESQAFVFVVDQQDVIHREPVTVIARSPRSADIAITGHVSAGDRIVLAPMGHTTAEKIRPNSVSTKAVAMAP